MNLTDRSSLVMLSVAKHLAAPHLRPFVEFTLSGMNVLMVTFEQPMNMSLHEPTVYHEPYAKIRNREDELHSRRKNIHYAD